MALRWSNLSALERTREFFKLQGVFNRSSHSLRAGARQGFYFDFDSVVFEPGRCVAVLAALLEQIRWFQDSGIRGQPVSYLAFIEKRDGGTVGALELAGALSIKSGIPFCLVRPGKFVLSERVKTPFIEGVAPNHRLLNQGCLIVTDHCTTGDELIEAAESLKDLGAEIVGAIAFTAMGAERYSTQLRDAGIELRYCHLLPEDAERVGVELSARS